MLQALHPAASGKQVLNGWISIRPDHRGPPLELLEEIAEVPTMARPRPATTSNIQQVTRRLQSSTTASLGAATRSARLDPTLRHDFIQSTTDGSLAVVIPALSELENLEWLLPAIRETLNDLPVTCVGVFVAVGLDADDSEIVAIERLGGTVLRRAPSNSFGDAVRTGIANVPDSATWAIFMDADGSHSPSSIPALIMAPSAADVVVASRYVDGGQSDNAYYLRWMSRVLNGAFAVILGLECRDISTNFKRYRVCDLKNIQLTCQDFDVIEEMLFQIKLIHGSSLKIVEIPAYFFERRFGQTKRRLGIYILSYLRTLLRLRLQKLADLK